MIAKAKRTLSKFVGVGEIIETARMIRGMAMQLDPRRIKAGRVETYDEARTRLRVNNDEINASRINHGRIFWIASAFLVVGWTVRIYVGFSIQDVIATIGFTAICISLMFRHSFRASQLKASRLHGIKEWARNSSHWIPDAF